MSDTTTTAPITYYYAPCPACLTNNPNYIGFQNCQGHDAPLPAATLVPTHDPLTCPCCRAAAATLEATLDPESFERFEARRVRAEALLKETT